MSKTIFKVFKVLASLHLSLVAIMIVFGGVSVVDAQNTTTTTPKTPAPATTQTPAKTDTAKPATTTQAAAPAPASGAKPPLNDCEGYATNLTITALLQPSSFVPLIPNSCSGGTGAPQALSLQAIPVVIVRIYGLLASLVFFLTGLNLIYASIRYSYGAFQESEAKAAINSIQESATSVVLVLTAHIIISTIFTAIFKIPLNTDSTYIQSFFN
jgi:hypothetical protein